VTEIRFVARFRRLDIWTANSRIVEKIAKRRAVSFGKAPAQLHALLAPQDADHSPPTSGSRMESDRLLWRQQCM